MTMVGRCVVSMDKPKLFVLGVDGATFNVILPMVKKGELPNFKKVMDKGAWGELESAVPPFSGPAWSSFMTGMKPVNHGVFDFVVKKMNTYEGCYVNSTYVKGRPFWEILGRYGFKVGVINVMVTYPPHPVNGFLITGGLTPPGKDFTYPTSLAKEITEKFGDYPILPVGGLTVGKDERKFVKTFFSSEEKRMAVARYLMENKDWDFFMVMCEAADPLQHELWKYLEQDNLSEINDYVKCAIPNFYKKVDAFLGEILDKYGDNATICIMSDHGFGPLKKYFLINNFLIKIGMLKLKQNVVTRFKKFCFERSINPEKFYLLARKLGVTWAISFFRGGTAEETLNRFTLSFNDVDWRRTKAFAIGTSGHIYLNVKGKELQGSVDKDTEYEKVREFIIQKLENLKDPETGAKVIKKIYRKEELHQGKFSEQAPDITFLPHRGYATLHRTQFVSPSLFISSANSGGHELNGISMFYGPKIKRGTKMRGTKIYDLAPTFIHMFNVPVPEDLDGKILEDIFVEPSEPTKKPLQLRDLETQRIKKKIKKIRKALNR
jgi:predicted AlkP superfamily phosphohydrolase/phosphomutase